VKPGVLLLTASLLLAPTLRAAPGSSAPGTPSLQERFRFHAGAPLLAPAGVAADGTVCVGTADGYVHLLGPDGDFRWSRSVRGSVVHRPVRAGALWLITTDAERIYALTGEGALYWVFKPLSPPVSELAVDAMGTAYFFAADRFFYGVSEHGAVLVRAPFGVAHAGPCAAADGSVWAENQAGNRIRAHGSELTQPATGAPRALELLSCGIASDARGNTWDAGEGGVLALTRPDGSHPQRFVVANSALLEPVWSLALGAVVVSARDGLVVALAAPRAEGF